MAARSPPIKRHTGKRYTGKRHAGFQGGGETMQHGRPKPARHGTPPTIDFATCSC